jgi:hypothetical protein
MAPHVGAHNDVINSETVANVANRCCQNFFLSFILLLRKEAAISIGLVCPSKKKHQCLCRLPVASLEFAFGLPVTSLEVQRQSRKYWHQCFFTLGHARPILMAALLLRRKCSRGRFRGRLFLRRTLIDHLTYTEQEQAFALWLREAWKVQ